MKSYFIKNGVGFSNRFCTTFNSFHRIITNLIINDKLILLKIKITCNKEKVIIATITSQLIEYHPI